MDTDVLLLTAIIHTVCEVNTIIKQLLKLLNQHTYQRILPLPNPQNFDFATSNDVKEDNKECSNPTQSTNNNKEPKLREDTGLLMTQNQSKCNDTKDLKDS